MYLHTIDFKERVMSEVGVFSALGHFDSGVLQALAGPYGNLSDFLLTESSYIGNGGLIWIVLALVLCARAETRKAGLTVFIALFFSLLLTNLTLKPLFDRARPCDLQSWCPKDPSFPSGHSTSSFAAASALWFTKEARLIPLALLMFALASTIAYSRLFLDVHYPTDCLTGIFLGFVCGYWAVHLTAILSSHKHRI